LPSGRFDRTFHPDGIECALEFRIEINVPAASQRFATVISELAHKQQWDKYTLLTGGFALFDATSPAP
jgi:hypothetical protein